MKLLGTILMIIEIITVYIFCYGLIKWFIKTNNTGIYLGWFLYFGGGLLIYYIIRWIKEQYN